MGLLPPVVAVMLRGIGPEGWEPGSGSRFVVVQAIHPMAREAATVRIAKAVKGRSFPRAGRPNKVIPNKPGIARARKADPPLPLEWVFALADVVLTTIMAVIG